MGVDYTGVFCLEGAWDDEDLTDRSSVRPVLDLLERLQSITYIHRDIGTPEELAHYIRRWLDQRIAYYVLYLAFHGTEDGICISDDEDGDVSLESLAELMEGELEDCIVHFGSCSVMNADADRLTAFLETTGASAVIGYQTDVDWVDSTAMDLLILGALANEDDLDSALARLEGSDAYGSLREELQFSVVRSA